MKKLLSILLLFASLSAFAQTYDTLPTGSKPYGNQLYLTPSGLIIGGTGSAKFRVIGTKKYVDSLLALKYTNAQIDALLDSRAPSSGSNSYIQNQSAITQTGSFTINSGKFDDNQGVTTINGGNVFVGSKLSVPLTLGNDSSYNAASTKWTKEQLKSKASLVGGKIPTTQLPDAILGSVNYQGNYNAATNSPALPAANGNKGKYYVVNVAGTQQGLNFGLGDWIISNGSMWEKVDNNSSVTSVAGKVGVVTLNKSDVELNNVDNTSDLNKPISTATTTALSGKSNLSGGNSFTGDQSLVGEKGKYRISMPSSGSGPNAYTRFKLDYVSNANVETTVLTFDATGKAQIRDLNLLFSGSGISTNGAITLGHLNNALATGETIGANTTGNAGSATNWGGRQSDLTSFNPALGGGILGVGTDGVVRQTSDAYIKTWLGLGSAASLSADEGISANTVVKRNSSGEIILTNDWTTSIDGIYASVGGIGAMRRVTNPTFVKSWLNTSLQDVTSVSNTTTNFLFTYDTPNDRGTVLDLYGVQSTNAANNSPKDLSLQRFGGNVGIGTTNPIGKFQVKTGTDHNLGFFEASTGVRLSSFNDAATNTAFQYDGSVHQFLINGVEKATIANNGNVGIGTTSPSEKLEVNGNIKSNGLATAISTKSANYTVTANDNTLIAETAGITFTLPDASTAPVGREYSFVNYTNGSITVTTTSGTGQFVWDNATLTTPSSSFFSNLTFGFKAYNGKWYLIHK